METVKCNLCGADDAGTLCHCPNNSADTRSEFTFVRCRQCGLIYLNPRPSVHEINAYYPSGYRAFRPTFEDERFALMRWMRRRKLSKRRKLVERYSGLKSGRILDVGCATGGFLHEMAQAGWQVSGVEPSVLAAEYARTRLGLEVFNGTLEQAPYPHQSFDVVAFWDVLEHTYSPADQLKHAASLLRPGGLLVISHPNWHSLDRRLFGPYWSGYDPPRHLYVFTRATLTAFLERSGFQPLDWRCFMTAYYPFIISVDYWLQDTVPQLAKPVSKVLNFPGVRLIFEPWFTVANWLKLSGTIAVFARKEGEV